MGCSLRGVAKCGLFLAFLDLIHAIATLACYGYELYVNFRCHWAHGIRACEFYLYHTNHNIRVNIGIGEGIVCIIFALLFAVALSKENLPLLWAWLGKGIVVLVLNMYFIFDWLIKRGRYYHAYWTDDEYSDETKYIHIGVALTMFQLCIIFLFCCVSASFTYKVRKARKPNRETSL